MARNQRVAQRPTAAVLGFWTKIIHAFKIESVVLFTEGAFIWRGEALLVRKDLAVLLPCFSHDVFFPPFAKTMQAAFGVYFFDSNADGAAYFRGVGSVVAGGGGMISRGTMKVARLLKSLKTL